jgi:hypothetical protein
MCPKKTENTVADDNFCDSTFFMWFAKSKIETTVPEADPSPLQKYEQSTRELALLGVEMKAADAALRNMFVIHKDPRIAFINGNLQARVNASKLISVEVRECEGRWAAAFRKFQQKMAESAELKIKANLTR